MQPPTTAGDVLPDAPRADIVATTLVMLACMSVLGLAAWLQPDARGFGTHEQLMLPPCGFKTATGLPCATCGMTTAFAAAAHGHLIDAVVIQPAGGVLAVATAAVVILCFYSIVTGVDLTPLWLRIWRPRVMLWLGLFVLAAWVYKIVVVTRTM